MNRIERRKKYKKERRRKRLLKRKETNTYRVIEVRIHYSENTGLKPLAVATCEDCVDYQSGDCKGGSLPEECIRGSGLL